MGAQGKLWGMALLGIFAVNTSFGKTAGEREADQKLAAKLLKLSQSLDMKEAKFPDSKGGGGKDFNANDGNSFTSNTTYHSYVWDYCLQWVGTKNCRRWLDPYVSKHGADADRSPLEGAVWEEYLKRKIDNPQIQGNQAQYAIWSVEARQGKNPIDAEGKLDREQLVDFRLLPDVAKRVAKVGDDTAQRQIIQTYDKDSGGTPQDTMPNMEGLRMMASRWTKMFRNRLVANIGELRANERNVEFALDEGVPNCDQYLVALRREMDRSRLEERRDAQANLDLETRTRRLEERYNYCQQMRSLNVAAVNPKIRNGQIEVGNPENAKVDEWKNRINIAAIDFVGLPVDALPKPNDAKLLPEDTIQEFTKFGSGGVVEGNIYKSNLEQIQGYNQALEDAAKGMKEAVAKSPQIRDNSATILSYKLEPGQVNMVSLNGMTQSMKDDLNETDLPRTRPSAADPELALEQSPGDLPSGP